MELNQIKYIDAILCLNGEYAIGSFTDDNHNAIPAIYDSYQEAQAEIDDMKAQYQEQIEYGERDEDDEYEGIVFACRLVDDTLILYDPETMTEAYQGNWKRMAGII